MMKYHQRVLAAVVAAVCLLLAACSGSDVVAEPAATAPAESPTAAPAESPTAAVVEESTETPSVVSEPSDEDVLAAVVAQLDAEVAAGAGPEGIIAYDLLESEVSDDGAVTLTICSWDGQTAFDEVRESIFRTTADADGTVTAQHISTPLTTGECLNTHLIESALDFVDAFTLYWESVLEDPASFPTNPLTNEYLEELKVGNLGALAEGLVDDGLTAQNPYVAGDVRGTAVAEILVRQVPGFSGQPLLEFAVCREMASDYGLYRDGALFDDGQEGNIGTHSLASYEMEADSNTELGWRISGDNAGRWTDCFQTGDWVELANIWAPKDEPFEVLPQ